jgi:hypothetical protein
VFQTLLKSQSLGEMSLSQSIYTYIWIQKLNKIPYRYDLLLSSNSSTKQLPYRNFNCIKAYYFKSNLNNYASSEIQHGMDYTHIQRPKINMKSKNFY